jgi:hypothetical protein
VCGDLGGQVWCMTLRDYLGIALSYKFCIIIICGMVLGFRNISQV